MLAAILYTVLVLILYLFCTQREGLLKDDAGQYARLAESPLFLARLPYTLRVLTPGLASALPGSTIDGFVLVTLSALILSCVALYLYQRVIGLGCLAALAGGGLFAVSGGPIRMLTTPTYVDSITYFAEALAFLALASGRYWVFLFALSVGTVNRETALFLIPLYFLTVRQSDQSLVKRTLVVGVPIAILAVIAFAKLSVGGVFGGGVPLDAIAPSARTFRQELPTMSDLFDLYSTFGAMWLLATINLPGPTSFQRRALVFGALVVLQLLVSRGDEGRNLSHLFVIVVPLAMLEVHRLTETRCRLHLLLATFLILACAASMIHARWTIFDQTSFRYALVGLGTLIAVGIAMIGRRGALTEPARS